MASEHLATYLNDHLAGSVAALELLTRLEEVHADTSTSHALAELRAEVAADRHSLESLMSRLRIDQSRSRQAVAWLAERASRIKLKLGDSTEGPLGRLEALEALALGIDGKRALWRALAAATEGSPELRGVDYENLTQRADVQRERVEEMRLEAARTALSGVR